MAERKKLVIPCNPTPLQLQNLIAMCSNQIATLSEIVAKDKADVAIKVTANKRAIAKAKIKYRASGTADIVKSLAEMDEEVVATTDALNLASNVYELARAELDAYDAHFTALRKIAEIVKSEIRGGVG